MDSQTVAFDLLHEGHRYFLTECRRGCDYLVVAVNSDAYCRRVKGKDRPYDNLQRRMLHVRSYAEAVIPFDGRQDHLIMEIRPNVVFKGGDHAAGPEQYAMRRPGWKSGDSPSGDWDFAPIIRIERVDGYSTTLEAAKLAAASKAG